MIEYMNDLLKKYGGILLITSVLSCNTLKVGQEKAKERWSHTLDTVEITASREYRASETRYFDLLHTKLDVRFDFSKQHLLGQAYLTLKPYFYPADTLKLDAKGFDIHRVALVTENESLIDLSFEYIDSLQLFIQLPRLYSRYDTFTLFIDYVAKPNERKSEGSRAITSNKGLYFINPEQKNPLKPTQIWTQGETESSSCWFPTIDKPNERTTAEICITVADTMTTLSNGLLTESSVHADGSKTECWTMTQPHAPYLFMMAIGKFAVVKDIWRGREVSYYVEPKYEGFARNIFGHTPEMLDFFSTLLGVEYPWPKYAQVVVRDYVSGAMENTSASVFLEAIQTTDRERLDRNWDFIIAHELFHQWFGDLVTCESWANLTLNEGFATYAEYLWNEYKYGKDEANYNLMNDLKNYLQEARIYQEPLIRYYYNNREDVFDAHTYEKGGLVLHMLRRYLGDDAFFKSLQHYLLSNQYKAVELHHLRLAFEEISGQDLNWFFNQWYLSPGHPRLTVKYQYDDSLKKQLIIIHQQPSSSEAKNLIYRLPVTVFLHTEEGVEQKKIVIDAKENRYEFQVNSRPKLIMLHTEDIILCEKEENKSETDYIHQFRYSSNIIDRHQALQKLWTKQHNKEVRNLFIEALQASHWSLREYAVKKLDLNDTLARRYHFETLKALALNDPKPQVRASAIERLTEYSREQQLQLFRLTIHDSSFLVASKTLQALLAIDTPTALSYAQSFEQFENSEISRAVGKVYAAAGGEDKNSFFENALRNREGVALYHLIHAYSDYLIRMNWLLAQQGVPLLQHIAQQHDSWWIRSEAGIAFYDILKSYRKKIEQKLEEMRKAPVSVRSSLDKEVGTLQQLVSEWEAAFQHIKQSELDRKARERYEHLN